MTPQQAAAAHAEARRAFEYVAKALVEMHSRLGLLQTTKMDILNGINRRVRDPFRQLMESHNDLLKEFMQNINRRVLRATSTDHDGALAIFLTSRYWDELDLLQRADGVLHTKEYKSEVMVSGWLNSRPGYPSPFPEAGLFSPPSPEHSLGHQHVPSLTTRQARRSGTSAVALRERWA
ncbi:hypothetical protein BCR35DRAFT_307298 [Leucosporidium creatinivorum]|uniref:Uncharacterized protein n=1 Tax=Leucosporidium creatinivorum TaxID=106004 RepID=A0A1Y2ENW2_9BASI|nr:hypothetical protein BCR35DRAFT_307298 [Leucosporidium creatinivorum]